MIRNVVVLHNEKIVQLQHLPTPLNFIEPPLKEINNSLTSEIDSDSDSEIINTNPNPNPKIQPLADVERKTIETAISFCNGSIPKAVVLLDVSPSTIYRKKQSWE